jgi:hypothetical protein
MYTLTCLSLKRQAKSLENKDDRHGHKFRVASEERFLRTVIIIAVIAVVSLTPTTIHGQMDNRHGIHDDNIWRNVVSSILMRLLCLNFSINPIIYFLRLKNYRKTFFLVFCRRHISWDTTTAWKRYIIWLFAKNPSYFRKRMNNYILLQYILVRKFCRSFPGFVKLFHTRKRWKWKHFYKLSNGLR